MFFLKIHKNNTFLGKKIQRVEKWEPSFAPQSLFIDFTSNRFDLSFHLMYLQTYMYIRIIV